ncbi:MAG: PhzF family phenazine biosynthesis protein [Candidatus Glassbacteria bacterium]
MKVRIFQVDAFTAEPFRGNPAGVCPLQKAAPDSWMQAVAAEMNLSETAFFWKEAKGFFIRYFTPLTEVPLCGHATLASAHMLWEENIVPDHAEITFISKSGILRARSEGVWNCLDFPAYPVKEAQLPSGLAEAIGAKQYSAHSTELGGYLIELQSEVEVETLNPDFTQLRRHAFGKIIVTARSQSESYDFVSRFFWPEGGVDEDPVTGSAHCSLGPFWAERLGKTDLVGHQLSKRGGVVRVRALGDRVEILGQAVTVIRGEIVIG